MSQEQDLTKTERHQIQEILIRRSNEIASFSNEYTKNASHFGSVEMALTREMARLRSLAEKVMAPLAKDEDSE